MGFRNAHVAKYWHVGVALIALCSVVGELFHRVHGASALDDAGVTVRIVRFFSYFTVQSNLLVAGTSFWLARDPIAKRATFAALRLAALVGITVTGIVYMTVLAPGHDPEGTAALTNIGLHYLSPLFYVAGWILFGPRPRFVRGTVLCEMLWPIGWLIYTLIHGEFGYRNWYPYVFLDVKRLGWFQVGFNALLITGLLLVIAMIYRWLDRRLKPTPPLSLTPTPTHNAA